jgi:hypothetical protein
MAEFEPKLTNSIHVTDWQKSFGNELGKAVLGALDIVCASEAGLSMCNSHKELKVFFPV